MKKYLTVFSVSWSGGFVYRLNFLLWRARSIIVILTVYFLWDAIFRNNQILFGYSRDKILTYVFLTLILRSIILSVRSIDVGGEISDGRLSNYLLKPVNYHVYWFTRDLADKILNIIFSVFEIFILYYLLKPPIFFQTDPLVLIGFGVAIILAIVLNFVLGTITSYTTFWTPGNTWGFWFVYLVIQELLSGLMFPIDILPKVVYKFFMLLPFPYLLYFPANVYLGKITGRDLWQGLIIISLWIALAGYILSREWRAGLIAYQSEGR